MTKTVLSVLAAAAIASNLQASTDAFSPAPFVPSKPTISLTRFAEEKPAEAVFIANDDAEAVAEEPADETLEAVEKFGKGAAKVGKTKKKHRLG